MIWAGALLLVYSVALSSVGAFLLRRASWTSRAPRLGVAAWQVLSASVLGGIALAGVLMLSPGPSAHADLHGLTMSAEMFRQGHFLEVAPALFCVTVIVLSGTLVLRAVIAVLRSVMVSRRDRARHLSQLSFLGEPDTDIGALIVEHPFAAAYCLPGPRPTVVLTTGALEALDGDELRAVLEHERAHLRGRHDLLLAGAGGIGRALRFLPVFGWAYQEQTRLLEMVADDAAATRSTRRTVATAMVHMADEAVPLPALGAGGADAAERVERMLQPSNPIGRWKTTVLAAALVGAALAPVGLAVAPAVTAAGFEACGLGGPSPR